MQNLWFKMPKVVEKMPFLAAMARAHNTEIATVVALYVLIVELNGQDIGKADMLAKADMAGYLLHAENSLIRAIYSDIEQQAFPVFVEKSAVAKRVEAYRNRQRETVTSNGHSNVTGNVTCNAESNGGVTAERRERENRKNNPPLPPEGNGEGDFKNLFQEFFSKRAGRGKATDSEIKAQREYEKLIAAGETHETLCNALQSYAAWCHSEGKAGTRWVKSVAAWLAEGDWRQYAGQQSMPLPPQEKTFAAMCADRGVICSPWLTAMAAKIGAPKALSFFGNAEFDGTKITFEKATHRNLAIAQHEHDMAEVFGKHFEMGVKATS